VTGAAAGASIEARLASAGLPPLRRTTWLEIDTEALASNLRLVRTLAPPGARLGAVLKANAYGHGLEVAARTFAAAGADLLCVATVDEALHLRSIGLKLPILVIFEVPHDAVGEARAQGVELVAADPAGLPALLAAAASGSGKLLRLHLEVETGLVRGGFQPPEAGEAAARIQGAPGVELAGLWTHFASSHDPAATARQRQRFDDGVASLRAHGVAVPPRAWAASGGLLADAAGTSELVRPGLVLYGMPPDGFPVAPRAAAAVAGLRPAMTLKVRPLRVSPLAAGEPLGYGGVWRAERPSVVATLPVGYGDGWARAYGGRTQALVRGRRVPLVGSVAMDAVMADVTDVPGVTTQDEFVLLGEQGGERITAADLALVRTTISWEVLASMSARVARVYHASTGLTGLRTLAGEHLRPEERHV
jgi:alanine racemase